MLQERVSHPKKTQERSPHRPGLPEGQKHIQNI